MLTRTKTGDPLVSAEDAAAFLKVSDASEHPLIASLVEAATGHCESYTGRDTRQNEYELIRTGFSDESDSSILLQASLVDTVSKVDRMVSGAWVQVAFGDYYLIQSLKDSKVKPVYSKSWPTDLDIRDQNVRVRFSTTPHKDLDLCRAGILRHVALMYSDRGDMSDARSGSGGTGSTLSVSTSRQSGAEQMYASIALVGI
jgi:hypothetical protein